MRVPAMKNGASDPAQWFARIVRVPSTNQAMNKTDLIQRLAEKHELSKAEAGRILETLLDTVVTSVKKGEAVTIPGFGSFKLHARPARNGVNPSNGEKIKIAAAKLPKFTPGATFKATVDPKGAAKKAAKAAAKPAAKAPKAAAKKAAAPAKKAAAKKAAKK
ncbi:HU family DNA-binding protein [Aquabacterium sp.]|uniref:HU family DNA-binding protein n=1 Tax=Aquabacterium sp. TaxID=1872578 RepID=UPI00345BB3AF